MQKNRTTYQPYGFLETVKLYRGAPLAIPLGNTKLVSELETKGGHAAGQALIRLAKMQGWRPTRFAVITGGPSAEAKRWCEHNEVSYLVKPIDRTHLERFLGRRPTKAFVVHGRDSKALEKIKKALTSAGIQPIVLMEQPEKGRTVIEKFEDVAAECDYAIILATPDDVGGLKTTNKRSHRMRQNVLFELGYFCGSYGRRMGRVVLIEFGESEIPTDIAGVIRIDGSVSPSKLAKKLKEEIL